MSDPQVADPGAVPGVEQLRVIVTRECRFNCDAESSCRCGPHELYRTALTVVADLRQQQEQRLQALDRNWHSTWRETMDRYQAAEASLTALREKAAYAELIQRTAEVLQLSEDDAIAFIHENGKRRIAFKAAEATGEAAISQIADLKRGQGTLMRALENAETELADRSAALAQIVQEMREWSDPMLDGINKCVREWADRLDAVGAERTTQRIE